MGYGAADRSRSYTGVFKLTNGEGPFRLADRGVEYEVTIDNNGRTSGISGRELAETGLTIRLDAALTSELVMYRKQ